MFSHDFRNLLQVLYHIICHLATEIKTFFNKNSDAAKHSPEHFVFSFSVLDIFLELFKLPNIRCHIQKKTVSSVFLRVNNSVIAQHGGMSTH